MNLIDYLQENGRVVLVWMPVDPKILKIENDFWINFDQKIDAVASQKNIKYLNFSQINKYQTYDGNHIDKFGGVTFTKELSDSIKAIRWTTPSWFKIVLKFECFLFMTL